MVILTDGIVLVMVINSDVPGSGSELLSAVCVLRRAKLQVDCRYVGLYGKVGGGH